MSKLDELIKELCSNGVEYKELKDLCEIKTGKLNANEMEENGIYPFFTCDEIPYKINKYAFDNEAILISGNGSKVGHINYYKGKFNAYQRTYVLLNFNSGIVKYFVFYLKEFLKKYIIKNSNKASVPYITLPMLEKFLIPIPPLEVQNEIVRILDNFIALTAELTAELTARKKQYSWYRDYLLKFENKVEIVKLGDISEYSKDKIDIKELSPENYIGIENMLQDAKGVIKSSCLLTEGRCTKFFEGDILIGNIRPYLKKIWLSDRIGGANTDVLVIKKSIESIDNKYLFFVLSSEKFFSYVMKSVKAGKMPRGNKEMIMKYQFPLPPLEVQKRIVGVLDNFEKICNDLNIGLPAEIEARQKQYEFYRNFLLTFDNEKIYALSKQASKQASKLKI